MTFFSLDKDMNVCVCTLFVCVLLYVLLCGLQCSSPDVAVDMRVFKFVEGQKNV